MHSLSKEQHKFYLFLTAMILVHACFLIVKVRDEFSQTAPSVSEIIKVKLIREAAQNFQNKRQIVQSEDSLNTEEKDKSFLSDKTRSFDRETVAKNIDSFKKAAKGNATSNQTAMNHSSQKTKGEIKKDLKLSDFGVASGDLQPEKVLRAPASESKKGLENGDLLSTGFSATNDYVQEVQLGDFTQLNTVEYKFYGFYHRIRQKLEQFWGKSIQEKSLALFKSGRRMPAGEDLITSLRITLNEKGEIVGVKILGTSGVKELDDAAIESFNQAGPFPNPPKDLLVNGKATIEWGFVVKS